jgi:AAHS family benzoate transporter-like MFS transporter
MSPTSSMNTGTGIYKVNINRWIDGASLTSFHWRIFGLFVLINAFDGYDLYVYSGTIPLIMKDFHISPIYAGAIASYMLMGSMVGALFLGTLTDRLGRKRSLVFFIALFSLGMFMVSRSNSPFEFAIWRFITGVGVGGSQPISTALCTEFSPRKGRGKFVSTAQGGLSVGSVTAALLGIWLYAHHSWRSVYVAGSLTVLMLPVYMAFLPESPVRLMRSGQYEKVRALLRKIRPHEAVPDNCELEIEQGGGKAPIVEIFTEGRAKSTVLFWVVLFMNSYGLFGFATWLPKLIMGHGYPLATGLTFMLAMATTTLSGSYIGGALADKLGFKTTLVLFYLTSFTSITLVGFTSSFDWLMLLVCLAGLGLYGAQNLLNSYMPPYYPPSMRSTATSVSFGLSRIGALTGPAMIGVLLAAGLRYQLTLICLASPVLISAVCITLVQEKFSFSKKIAAEEQKSQVQFA